MHILNTIVESGIADWIIFPIALAVGCGIVLLAFGGLEHPFTTVIAYLLLGASLIFIGYEVFWGSRTVTYYDVAFHDPVDMNDFLDKYEIVDINGHIIRIKEREQ